MMRWLHKEGFIHVGKSRVRGVDYGEGERYARRPDLPAAGSQAFS